MLAAIIPAKEVFGCSEDSLMDSLREEFPQKESYSEQRTMLAQEMMHTNRCKCSKWKLKVSDFQKTMLLKQQQ